MVETTKSNTLVAPPLLNIPARSHHTTPTGSPRPPPSPSLAIRSIAAGAHATVTEDEKQLWHSRGKRYALLAFASLQCALFAGVIYGWPTFSLALTREKVYFSACDCGPVCDQCDAQQRKLNLVYTVTTSVSMATGLISGHVLDRWGPRICLFLSQLVVAIGAVAIAITTGPDEHGLFFGFILLGFGGPSIQSALIHVGNLFPNSRAMATFCITGAFQLSFVVLTMFNAMNQSNDSTYSLKNFFFAYAALAVVVAFVSLYVWPNEPYAITDDYDSTVEETVEDQYVTLEDGPVHDDVKDAAEELSSNDLSGLPLLQQLKSGHFIYFICVVSFNILWANYYLGTLADRTGNLVSSQDEKDMYVNVFNIMLPCGVAVLFPIGISLDRKGVGVTIAIITVLGLFYGGLIMIPHIGAQVPAVIFYACWRTALFAFLFAYIGRVFGFEYYGILSGIVLAVSGVVGLLQYLIGDLVHQVLDHAYWQVNIAQLCSLVPVFLFAYYLRERNPNATMVV
eukprot:GFYU01007176.1.p1 GENE.GFYU01007176.1~~GFYU01007176.1.p1  ORF type:complete len:510 (-),score=153.01 GFYU01007176.1:138-1667(-)